VYYSVIGIALVVLTTALFFVLKRWRKKRRTGK
jgi:hypothetical protein